jgi:glycosyltransferase involved in cell wall biosynthesis
MNGGAGYSERRLPRLEPGESADVGLLLEGTYPYVSGGVSSWVHEIITGLPDLTFGVIFLGASPETYGEIRYQLPRNLVHVETHYLMSGSSNGRAIADADADADGKIRPRRRSLSSAMAAMVRLHDAFKARDGALDPRHLDAAGALDGPGGISLREFLSDDQIWARLCEEYDARCPSTSFLDYFWTVRTMHRPLFTLAELARRAPRFRLLHAVSTGYAGFLGALLQRQRGCPFIVTEHGIYTKERKIDLASAEYVPGDGDPRASGFGRRLWLQFFHGLGRIAYASADHIIALHEGSRRRQIHDGADPVRTRVIPNGVDLARFAAIRRARPQAPAPVLGFLGRLVPIKDVKCFLRAMKAVVARCPEAQAQVVGPASEDPAYARECVQLAASLGLEGRVRFTGYRPAEDVLPELSLLVLTSISEGLPLVVLEAFASGLPVVTTDVGACRELVEGRTPEDCERGPAGAVVPIADPDAVARAALELLGEPARWRAAQRAAIRRVDTYYAEARVVEAYRQLYGEACAWRA